jgi:integrase/recombinase XerD
MAAFSAMPYDKWPELDRRLWSHAMSASEILDSDAVAATWRDATKATVMKSYGYALDWLQRSGHLRPQDRPAERWSRQVIADYIADLRRHVSAVTTKQRVLNLERALAAMEPKSDRSLLQLAVRRLEEPVSHARKRDRLQAPSVLEGLGRRLMDAARRVQVASRRKNAVLFRDGLQIALLARRPLRKGNFVSIEIGNHLVRERENWRLRFAANEMKNHQDLDIPFPNELKADLEEYLEVYRPLLAGSLYRGLRLWVTYHFSPQSAHALQLSISHRTEQAFGKPINPHLFRDCAATHLAIDDPQHVRVAAAVLGHRSFATTQRHYNLSRTIDASRTVNAFLEGAKKRARRSSP